MICTGSNVPDPQNWHSAMPSNVDLAIVYLISDDGLNHRCCHVDWNLTIDGLEDYIAHSLLIVVHLSPPQPLPLKCIGVAVQTLFIGITQLSQYGSRGSSSDIFRSTIVTCVQTEHMNSYEAIISPRF